MKTRRDGDPIYAPCRAMMVLRHAWRSLLRTPGFAFAATATFALGIGVNAAVFASVDRLLFRPLPYRDPDRLFLLEQVDLDSGQRIPLPARYLVEARAQPGLIEDAAVLGDSTAYFATPAGDGPEIRVSFVSSRMLDVAGVRPAIGRGFLEEDDRLNRQVAVLTHEGWRARFGADPDILGRRIWWRDRSLEIVGVLPPGFIVPGAFIDPNIAGIGRMASPTYAVNAILSTAPPTVRLRPGVTLEAAQAAIDGLVDRLQPEMPRTKGGRQPVRLVPIRRAMFGQYFAYLWLVLAGAALVLVITCANLAGLFLVRGRARLRETAVRLSLGASRRRLLADALAEGLVVCLLGTTAALLTLHWSTRALDAILPPIFSRFSSGVDARVVAVALAASAVAGVAASILPARLLAREDLWRVIQGGRGRTSSGASRRGRWLLAVEAAIGVVLVAGAAVTARNLTRLTAVELGFNTDNLHLVLITSTAGKPAERHIDLEQALAITRTEPGVVSAAGSPALSVLRTGIAPFSQNGPPCCRWQVTGDFAATIGVPLLAGRAITDEDVRARAPVAMLSEAGLRRVWPGVTPAAAIGRSLALDAEPAREVVGVIGDTRRGYDDDVLPGIYVPVVDDPFGGMLIVARTQPGPPLRFSALRPRVDTTRRSLIYVRPMAPMYDRFLEAPRFRARLFGAFGVVALVVAMVGLHALTSFEVLARRRELGVRVALGASAATIWRLVLTDSGKPVLAGLAAGIGAALWAGQYLQSFLYRFSARDPWSLVLAAAALILTTVLAASVPAWHAARVDAAEELRSP